MSLSRRIAVIVGLLAVTYCLAGYMILRHLVRERFLEIERGKALDDSERVREAMLRELHHLALANQDWAYRDDLWRYAQDGRDPDYVSTNLGDASISNLGLDALWIVDRTGRVLFSRARDVESGAPLALAQLPRSRFRTDDPLLPSGLTDGVTTLVRTKEGPLLLAARHILTSSGQGPSRGWVLFGRLLHARTIESLRERTHVMFDVWDADDPAIDAAGREALRVLATGERHWLDTLSDDVLHAYTAIPGLSGEPAVLLRLDIQRDIAREGDWATEYATTSLVVGVGVTMALLLLVLTGLVVRPLRRLTEHADYVGRTGDLTRPSGIERGDEIGTLASAFDDMVERLAESRSELAVTARAVGQAEVARGILHNVGNVLNNATVAASSVSATVRQSRLGGLGRAVALLEGHRAQLARFLAEDERGRQVPDYLIQLNRALAAEHAAILEDVRRLTVSLEHAAEIVKHQEVLAGAPAHEEPVTMPDLLASASAVMTAGFERHGIRCEWRVERVGTVLVDRAKVLQVLINLLANAEEALGTEGLRERRITVQVLGQGDRLRFRVADTGPGIQREDLARIFQSGFTTKAGGRGLGLHFCALAATEMGGRLLVESEGPGQGATFTLDLPLKQAGPPSMEQAA